jgi:hypothetical protein
VKELFEKGYFPRELPPPFNTISFATFATSVHSAALSFNTSKKAKNFVSRPVAHNLARVGSLRRRLSIPNPVAFFQTASVITANWKDIVALCGKSSYSLSTPTYPPNDDRGISTREPFKILPLSRAHNRAAGRFLLRTDINAFYPSIYTHGIAWAIHGKAVAKKDKSHGLWGNTLDAVVRNGQDQQTVGIPIGPDTSLVIAELILSKVDEGLQSKGLVAFRYLDDYEICTTTYAAASKAQALMVEALSAFELQLNPRKTQIQELPTGLEESWAPQLRQIRVSKKATQQKHDLLTMFGSAFELARENRQAAILKFALGICEHALIEKSNWPLYQDLLLQCAMVEPGTLPRVVAQLYQYSGVYAIDAKRVQNVFADTIETNAPLDQGSEVAWALWGSIVLKLPILVRAYGALAASVDNVVALLALDAKTKGLINPGFSAPAWAAMISGDELSQENWLLSYEAGIKGWLPSVGGGNHLAGHPLFAHLASNNVSFYDASYPIAPPTTAAPLPKPEKKISFATIMEYMLASP